MQGAVAGKTCCLVEKGPDHWGGKFQDRRDYEPRERCAVNARDGQQLE